MRSRRADSQPLLARDVADVAADVPKLAVDPGRGPAYGRRDLQDGLHELCVDPRLELVAGDRLQHRVDVLDEVEGLRVEQHVLLLDAERVRIALAERMVEHAHARREARALARDGRRIDLLAVENPYESLTARAAVRRPRSPRPSGRSRSADTTTMVLAGRTSRKSSPCARPTSSQSFASRRNVRVRTTCCTSAPASLRAVRMISRQRRAWPYASGGGSPPSGITAQVPATKTCRPSRTAREKPTFGSNGDPDDTRRRSIRLVSRRLGSARTGRRLAGNHRGRRRGARRRDRRDQWSGGRGSAVGVRDEARDGARCARRRGGRRDRPRRARRPGGIDGATPARARLRPPVRARCAYGPARTAPRLLERRLRDACRPHRGPGRDAVRRLPHRRRPRAPRNEVRAQRLARFRAARHPRRPPAASRASSSAQRSSHRRRSTRRRRFSSRDWPASCRTSAASIPTIGVSASSFAMASHHTGPARAIRRERSATSAPAGRSSGSIPRRASRSASSPTSTSATGRRRPGRACRTRCLQRLRRARPVSGTLRSARSLPRRCVRSSPRPRVRPHRRPR